MIEWNGDGFAFQVGEKDSKVLGGFAVDPKTLQVFVWVENNGEIVHKTVDTVEEAKAFVEAVEELRD